MPTKHYTWWSTAVESDDVLRRKSESGDIVLVLRWRRGDPLGLDGFGLRSQLVVVKKARWATRARWADSQTRAVDFETFRAKLKDNHLSVYKHKQAGLAAYEHSYHVGFDPQTKALKRLKPQMVAT
jgi:hypothetical protein